MVPNGKAELIEPFAVIRDAMAGAGRVAIGRVVMTGRERVVAIEVRGKGLLLSTLHAADEVRSDADLFDEIPATKPDKQMVEIAQAIIGKQEGPFDPSQFQDRYADAMRRLVMEKSKGRAIAPAETHAESNVIDLMEALRNSLRGGGPEQPADAPPKKSAKPRAPASPKPAAARRRRA